MVRTYFLDFARFFSLFSILNMLVYYTGPNVIRIIFFPCNINLSRVIYRRKLRKHFIKHTKTSHLNIIDI